ncbi:MAG: phospholipase D-like domain-containing protein [Patescibacteria group bacterium]
MADLLKYKEEVIIESPFITTARMHMFYSVFEELMRKCVKVVVVTRDPREHTNPYKEQSEAVIQWFERIGIQPLLCVGNHHRKLAIVDRKILWEGSLNILSQMKSREIMRRIDDKQLTEEMFRFLKLGKVL